MTLTTSATATFAQSQYTVQILAVDAVMALLPGVNRARVTIAAGAPVDATPGAAAAVALNGGNGEATIITGTVCMVERSGDATVVTVTDAGSDLARIRPFETYEGSSAAQVITKLADVAAVDTGQVVALLQTAAYVADPSRTMAEHISGLASRSGSVAHVDADGRLVVMPWPTGPALVAMREDREFVSLMVGAAAEPPRIAPVGGGGSGVARAPDAWVPSTEAVTGADNPSASQRWQPDLVLRASVDVNLAAQAAQTRRQAASARLYGRCWLQPARRPGDVVTIEETTSDQAAGPWLVTSVRHSVTWDSASTTLLGIGGGSLDSIAGAFA